MIEITVKLGQPPVVKAAGTTLKDAIKEIGFLSDLPCQCAVCGSAVGFYFKETPDGNAYYGLRCNNTGERHELTFGQHKQGGTLFLRWNEPWRIKGTGKLAEGQEEPQGNRRDDEDEHDGRQRQGGQPQGQSRQPQRGGGSSQYDGY